MKKATTATERRKSRRAAEARRKALWKGICITHKAGRELAFFGIVAALGLKLPEIATNLWFHLSAFALSTWTQIMSVFGLA